MDHAGTAAANARGASRSAQPPAISLPKGGGAIRGMGEKFSANPVTGSGAMSVPIAVSEGRSGFGPELTLSYDSGAGNGPFGLGWDLALPAITRKTDKGLPRYLDADDASPDSDVFILSGAEDLVPVLNPDGSRWIDETRDPEYSIHRFRPRTEGLFARIERWTRRRDGDIHWRSISGDNVLTIYGGDAGSRISDPADPTRRTFSWLISETRDDRGNAVLYDYRPENGAGIDPGSACEANRGAADDPRRAVNRYLKRIRYGNTQPLLCRDGSRPRFAADWQAAACQPPSPTGSQPSIAPNRWLFEVVLDYGDHGPSEALPTTATAAPSAPTPGSKTKDIPLPTSHRPWDLRPDPFSSYRAGFEIRTHRLCQRVLIFHHFPDQPDVGANCLVRSTDFHYRHEQRPDDPRNPVYSMLQSVTQTGYRRHGNGGYVSRVLPPLDFHYSEPRISQVVKTPGAEALHGLPAGLAGEAAHWIDLDCEGIPGILMRQGSSWCWWGNRSPLRRRLEDGREVAELELAAPELLPEIPAGSERMQFANLAGDRCIDLVAYDRPVPGFFERTEDGRWTNHRTFQHLPNIDWRDPSLRLVDLSGDGHADILIDRDEAFVWHPSKAEAGFGPAETVRKALDEERGPRRLCGQGSEAIFLADMSGDGLADIVRVRRADLCYWPNLGYGRFGAKIAMDQAPVLDSAPELFDPRRVRLADIDGTGTNDLIYLGTDGARLWHNQSGNGWGAPIPLPDLPGVDDPTRTELLDLLGNGTACLVWSSPLPGDRNAALRYIDLMGGQKPHLLTRVVNNLGAETEIHYAPSTRFYLQDKQAGQPWITKLPYPVHVVERVVTRDLISRNRFVTRYAYHHGYFDDVEREFRGFGMVEQWDTDEIGALAPSDATDDSAASGRQSREAKYQVGDEATASIQGVWQFSFRPIRDIKPSSRPNGGWYYFFDGVGTGIHEDDIVLRKTAGPRPASSVRDSSRSNGNGLDDGKGPPEPAIDDASNTGRAFRLPPTHTKTWYHTGAYLDGARISLQFKGDYYREPGLKDEQADALLLPDTILPPNLTAEAEREACRALRGAMLRQEVYADDDTNKAAHPYTVTEQNFTVRRLQRGEDNRHAVFFTHPREALSFHYERNPEDPRFAHSLTLEVDDWGNVLQSAAIAYGRRADSTDQQLSAEDHRQQRLIHITYEQNHFTNAIDQSDDYRTPLPAETCAYEVRRPKQDESPTGPTRPFGFERVRTLLAEAGDGDHDIAYENVGDAEFAAAAKALQQAGTPGEDRSRDYYRRLIEQTRSLYRANDLEGLLPARKLQSLALPGESYRLAYTPGLLAKTYLRPLDTINPSGKQQDLIDLDRDPASHLAQDPDGLRPILEQEGGYVDLDQDGHWWIPSGCISFDPDPEATTLAERIEARRHFYVPRCFRDPFGHHSFVDYDRYNLLPICTQDALDNRVDSANDYRVLQPWQVTDPNGNRSQAAFDALGLVVATAVMGKTTETLGDELAGFEPDPITKDIQAFFNEPLPTPGAQRPTRAALMLGHASTRIVYDIDRWRRCGQPPAATTLAREIHWHDAGGKASPIQISLAYSDGFGREIQTKAQAEPGLAPERSKAVELPSGDQAPGILVPDKQNGSNPKQQHADARWVGTGRTVFNNKGKPVKQYEPFFSATHLYEPEPEVTETGVTPILFYDPLGRVIATLHPNQTFEKVLFDPWRQQSWDVNDTVLLDPRTDPDIAQTLADWSQTNEGLEWTRWYDLRTKSNSDPDIKAELIKRYPREEDRTWQQDAATKAAVHAGTPTTAHLDSLGRTFATVQHNRRALFDWEAQSAKPPKPLDGLYVTRVVLDIEGNEREVRDAIGTQRELKDDNQTAWATINDTGRLVMRYRYHMAQPEEDEDDDEEAEATHRIHQASMDAGERWTLTDIAGNPIRAWDSRGHDLQTRYDELRRPVAQIVRGTTAESDPRTLANEILIDAIEYGEGVAAAEDTNLRTRIYRHRDSAGVVTNAGLDASGKPQAYDFKGNLLRSTRQLVSDYKAIPDWQEDPKRDDERFETGSRYDALNRPIQSIAPHNIPARPGPQDRLTVIQPSYNAANLLERVDVWLERAGEPAVLLNPNDDAPSSVGVDNIDYDAKGQRLRIDYKNHASTFYDYDPLTYRLRHLYTRRGAAFASDCDNPNPPPPATIAAPGPQDAGKSCGLQNLRYTYDPAGNITHIRDDGQQTVIFANAVVEPHCDYTYDALYRLVLAEGREHAAQNNYQRDAQCFIPDIGITFPNSPDALQRYTEEYRYDAVGNIEEMSHRRLSPQGSWAQSWNRFYRYALDSNRLLQTSGPGDNRDAANYSDRYEYDTHGSMTRMPHLPLMAWDFEDQLRASAKQVRDDGGTPETTYYVYDAAGERVRKVTERQAGPGQPPRRLKERLYLGGFEIYREYNGDGTTKTLERQTLHVMDDEERVALVETLIEGPDTERKQLIRYQLGNHLGSVSLELDHEARVISYEEYHPYGTTAYQVGRNQAEVSSKRYRYTGKERDEENGLTYHGRRYNAPWLGRWVSPDPLGLVDTHDLYEYVRSNPIKYSDPGGTHPTNNWKGRIGDQESFIGDQKSILANHGAEGRYIFTRRGGWLDRSHLVGHISATIKLVHDLRSQHPKITILMSDSDRQYAVSYRNQMGGRFVENPWATIGRDPAIERKAIALMTDFDIHFEHEQRLSPRSGIFARSHFSFEDMTSNRVGMEIAFRFMEAVGNASIDIAQHGGHVKLKLTKDQEKVLSRITRSVIKNLQPVSESEARSIYRSWYKKANDRQMWITVLSGMGQVPDLNRPITKIGYSRLIKIPKNFTAAPYFDPILSPIDKRNVPAYLRSYPSHPFEPPVITDQHRRIFAYHRN